MKFDNVETEPCAVLNIVIDRPQEREVQNEAVSIRSRIY
jgi:hypothetical protein